MQRRVYNQRPSWQLEVTEPIAGNYYPITAAAALLGAVKGDDKDDANHHHQQQQQYQQLFALTVATDRAQGAASLAEGQLEVMLHR